MRFLAFTSIAIASALVTNAALADDAEPPPKPRPTSPDTRTGRATLGLEIGYGRLFGNTDINIEIPSYASWGAIPSVQLAIPVSRYAAIEAWGSYASFNGGTDDCQVCSARSIAGGLGGVYHLVDGIPFDPWFSAGFGYRQIHLKGPTQSFDYKALVLPRFKIGMDYYPWPAIGFGPFFEASINTILGGSAGALQETDMPAAFSLGFRLVLAPFN